MRVRRVSVSALCAGLALWAAGCSAGVMTRYPPSDATMDRFAAGSKKLGCTFEKTGKAGAAVGMGHASVSCPDGRKMKIAFDSRRSLDPSMDTEVKGTIVTCSGALAEEDKCLGFAGEIFGAGKK
jgi:hypothetical protein